MPVGPLELFVLAFPGQGVAEGAPVALDRAHRAAGIRVLDALVVAKDGTGTTTAAELTDVAGLREVAAACGLPGLATAGMIDAEDADEVGMLLEPDTTALAMLVEHVWAREVAEAIQAADGVLVAAVHVPDEHAAEAVAALARHAASGRVEEES